MNDKNTRKFDLNIEKVLEAWSIHDALREVIANAIDEQILSNTKHIKIFKQGNKWHIRDFGRGLKYEHFTQNEDEEKLDNPDKIIGKFGVGLKDAFAVFDRHKIKTMIISKHGDITLGNAPKEDFPNINTLHAFFSESSDRKFIGTDFSFSGVKDKEMSLAKDFFLKFSDEKLLEETEYGQVLKRGKQKARIYIHGVRVSEEDNFLFSYNITSLTSKMRRALNRERTNVGRTAYTDRVKAILLECKKKNVAQMLVSDLKRFDQGDIHDELSWMDVSVHACRLLNSQDNVIFLTPYELIEAKDMVNRAKDDGLKVITIPENIKDKIVGLRDLKGEPIRELGEYTSEWNKSFKFKFVNKKDLTHSEREIFDKHFEILDLIGGKPRKVKEILVSETMRLRTVGYKEALGIWEENSGRVIIKRTQLKNLKAFAGTLLHELAHATSGASDISSEFEDELTKYLGAISHKYLY